MKHPTNKRERYHLTVTHAKKPWQIKREKSPPKFKKSRQLDPTFTPAYDVFVDGNHVGQLFTEV